MPPLEVGIPRLAVAGREPGSEQPSQSVVAAAGVVEPIDEVGECPLERLEFRGGEVFFSLRGRAADAEPASGPRHTLTDGAVPTADDKINRRPPRLEPHPDLVPDDLSGRRRQFHLHAALAFQKPLRIPPAGGGPIDGVEPASQTLLGIGHHAHRAGHCLPFDAVEVAGREPLLERLVGTAGREFGKRMQRDPARLGGVKIVRSGIDRRRRDARLGGKRGQPAGDPLPLPRPVHHVEDDDHRFASDRGGREEVADRGVVVLLLCEHGDDHIGGVANEFGPVPVLAERAVDVGGIENDEPLGLLATRVFPPDEHVGGLGIDRVGVAPPGNRPEAREERGQIGAGGDAPGEARDGMERAGGFGRRATDVRADKRVGDQALAGVRAAADGGDQQRLPRHLRPQLAVEGAVPCGGRRIGDAERGGHWRQAIDRSAEFSHAPSPGGKRRRGGLATGHHALPRLGTPLLLIHHAGRTAAAFVATAVSPP